MINHNDLQSVQIFASESEVLDPAYQTGVNYSRGFEPLETLPAAWYNQIMQILTKQAQATKSVVDSIYTEVCKVIQYDDTPLDPTSQTQLYAAIVKIAEPRVATALQLGSVLSSGLLKNILVNADGTATVNALADWDEDLDGTIKDYIARYVEDYAGDHYQFFPDYDNRRSWVSAWTDETGYKFDKNGFVSLSFGALTQGYTIYVHNINAENPEPKQVNRVKSACAMQLPVRIGDVLNIVGDDDAQIPLSTVDIFDNTLMMCFIPCTVVSDAPSVSADYAEAATYLRPKDSDSVRVTADEYGNLTAHEMVLKTAAEFGDGIDDTYI